MKQYFLLLAFFLASRPIHGLSQFEVPKSSHCKKEKEHFQPQKTYSFKYNVDTKVKFPQIIDNTAGASIECVVELNAQGECKYTLNVKTCSLNESAGQLHYPAPFTLTEKEKEFSTAITRYPVGFTMSDGAIEALMTHTSETPSILNFKRGIITSMLTKKSIWKESSSEIQHAMTRTDVQGTCLVYYSPMTIREDVELLMFKSKNRCHLPSRTNWNYSPFSLIWNTSLIHAQTMDSYTECRYRFNEVENLKLSFCDDKTIVHGISSNRVGFKAADIFISQKLTLTGESALKQDSIDETLNSYQRKGIQFEFERNTGTPGILPGLKERVHGLMTRLLTDPEKPIEPKSAYVLDELVDVLRNSANLESVMEQCWTSSKWTADKKYTEKEIQLGDLWKTVLIQCNRAHCTKAFRSMLDWDPKYLEHVVTEVDLNIIFLQWSDAAISDFNHIDQIIDIVVHKFNNRLSMSVLSTMIYNFRKRFNDEELSMAGNLEPKHRDSLERLISFVKKPIGTDCSPSTGYENMDVVGAIQAYVNIAPLLEYMFKERPGLDIYQKCIENKEHWPISFYTLQATKRLQPTKDLYSLLWKTLKNPSSRHEDHVMAYLVLAEKFGGAHFVKEILDFLEESAEKKYDHNLRTFIVTHLRAVAKNNKPGRFEFAKAIQKAMAHKPNLFRAIPVEKPIVHEKGKDADYYSKQVPWNINVNDDFIFDEGHFSKYTEEHYAHGIPQRQSIGYGMTGHILYNTGSYYPYAIWGKDYLDIFGKKYHVSQVGLLTKGLDKFVKAINSYFKDMDGTQSAKDILAGIGEMGQLLEIVGFGANDALKSKLLSYPYKIDERILKHLKELHKKKIEDISENGQSLDIIYQVGILDGFFLQMSLAEIPKLTKWLITAFQARMGSPYKSRPIYWKAVEAESVIPTIAGMSLNWTTDAYFISNSRLEMEKSSPNSPDEDSVFQIGGSFSGLTTVNLAVQLDLPGYASYGANTFMSVSSNVGANVELHTNVVEKKVKVQLELPQRSMQLLSYKGSPSIIRHYHVIAIPATDDKHARKSHACTYKLSSLLGFKLCHGMSYYDVSQNNWDEPQCSLLAGDSSWNYSMEYIAKHKVAYQFGFHHDIDVNSNINTVEVDIKSRDPNNVDKYNTLVKWNNKYKKGASKTQITAPAILPTFNIQATLDRLGDNGSHFKLKANLYPGETTYLDYLSQNRTEYIDESTMKSRFSTFATKKQVQVPVSTTTFNLTTSSNYYGYNFQQHEFPLTAYTDIKFQYKSLKESHPTWLSAIIRHPNFWASDGGAWLKFHREAKNYENDPKSEDSRIIHQCYNHIKLPGSTLRWTMYFGPTPDTIGTFDFNFTHNNPVTNKLLHFINVTSSMTTKKNATIAVHTAKANTTMNLISMAAEFEIIDDYLHPTDARNLTLTLRKEELTHKIREEITDQLWWEPNTNAFRSKTSSAKAVLRVEKDDHLDWEEIEKSAEDDDLEIIVDVLNKNYYYQYEYFKDEQFSPSFQFDFETRTSKFSMHEGRYMRHFSINSPTEKIFYEADFTIDPGLRTVYILWKSTLRLPNNEPTFYLFNVSSQPGSDFLYVTEDLSSKSLKRNTHVAANYDSADVEIAINSQSQVDPLFNLQLKGKYTPGGTVIKVNHAFMNIDFESKRQHGYTSEAVFNGKNLEIIPNMTWKMHYPDMAEGTTIAVKFPDFFKEFYIFARTEYNATRLLIDVCINKNCTISDVDSNDFVAEIDLSLEDPQILTRTVSFSPKALKHLENFAFARIEKNFSISIFHTSLGIYNFYLRNNKESIIKEWFNGIAKWVGQAAEETFHFFAPFGIKLGENLFEMFHFAFVSIWTILQYLLMPIVWVSSPRSGFARCTEFSYAFERDIAELPVSGILEEWHTMSGWFTPGPVPGKSYVAKTPLPVYWTKFNQFPLQLSPLFYRKYLIDSKAMTQDAEYERHALFIGNGDIYTFDGRVRHFGDYLRGSCPYLLSHDYEEKEFSIYYQSSGIHFLFPDMSLTIGSTGSILVNETLHTDLPFINWNGHIRVTRNGYLVELTTSYDMKVTCSINDFYCLFYTNEKKFNAITGLLGNNNDNPMDEPKDAKHFELSGHHKCKDGQTGSSIQSSIGSNFVLFWPDLLWNPRSPTLACHDLISPRDIFAKEYIRNPYAVPCSLMNGYLALCAAKGVPVGKSYRCTKCQSGYPLHRELNVKVENKVDVLFIIDLMQRESSKNFLKGVKSLAESFNDIDNQHYNLTISYGLVGYNGKGYWNAPQQHTMNGKLIGNLEEFTKHGLKTLTFDGPSYANHSAQLSAIKFSVQRYNLNETSANIYIIMTPKDPPSTQMQDKEAKQLAFQWEFRFGALQVFSNYEEFKDNNMFGMKDTGSSFPGKQPKDWNYPKGVLAKLASLSNGTVWQLPYLEKDESQPKLFNKLVSVEVLEKAKKEENQCRSCYCSINSAKQPSFFCYKKSCEEEPAKDSKN